MAASDPLTDLLANDRADAARALDAAQRHLVMLRSLRAEIWDTYRTLVPAATGRWRSEAADRYAERLDELRRHLFRGRDAVDGAEAALVECVDRLRSEHDALSATPLR
ncbi:hypothetical protein [Agromyces sp. Marseille-P2726]|uniref:hypothetical protein n=1 Tax=Agromyces sp. Marseille-P2726 TaxID=2709132 RepID=UPI0015715985|nr:hypothetical protein [Agromyces sp. Marseille-P2726]